MKQLVKEFIKQLEGIDFKIIKTNEYKTWYAKTFLKNLSKIIDEVKPDALVIIWPYVLRLLFNPFFLV